jgi:hypothetical protein
MEDSVTAASASRTSDKTSSNRRATRDPSIEPPPRFERIPKEPGSKKLILGEWVEVKPDDEDARN